MELVLAHRNMDFDCLASQLAVTKLYPAARIAPAQPLSPRMKNFLSLYRDQLPLVDLQYIDENSVAHVFVVDCHSVERLDDRARRFFLGFLERGSGSYTIFDHHDNEDNALLEQARHDSILKTVGSAATILVEILRERKVALSSFEATVIAAGIYEDTGCLTHRGTTESDALAVAYCLSQGADLERVNEIIRPKFDESQANLFESLLSSAKSVQMGAAQVTVCSGGVAEYIDGLAEITSRLLENVSADVLVSVVNMRDRVHIVGRSQTSLFDLRNLVRDFGGGGHAGAASAVVKEKNIDEVRELVWNNLTSQQINEPKASEIMTSPVRIILPEVSMDEAGRIMLRYSADGLVVMDDGKILGIVSKRDVDKARHHKLGHAPVRGFMSTPVITVSPDTVVSNIQSTMVAQDIGRVPVVDQDENLLGIVGRHELLKALYGDRERNSHERSYEESNNKYPDSEDPYRQERKYESLPGSAGFQPAFVLGSSSKSKSNKFIHSVDSESARDFLIPQKRVAEKPELLQRIEPELKDLYRELGEVAAQLNMVAYLVGGCVRDLVLERANFDLDFVVEGSAADLAHELVKRFGSKYELVAEHDRFNTATLYVGLSRRREIDIATARIEYYEYPAALPTVEASSLEQDLFRRDFTVNALAMSLHPDKFGALVDYFGGLNDMQSKLIRVLHPFSFIEDPTRIVRAARFASRLSFELEPRTEQQAQRAIQLGIFDNLGGVRLKEELRLILESPQRLEALALLDELGGGLRFLDSGILYKRDVRLHLRRAEKLLARYELTRSWIVYLGVLMSALNTSASVKLALERLHLAEDERLWILDALEIVRKLSELEARASRSAMYRVLHGHSDQSLAIAASVAAGGSNLRRWIKIYFEELKEVKTELNGRDLMEMGIPQGPMIGTILARLRDGRLDRELKSSEDEKQFVKANFSDLIVRK